MPINAGELIRTGEGRKLCVVTVVPTEGDSPLYVGLPTVEPA